MVKSTYNNYVKSNKLCPLCNLLVTAQDLEDLNYIWSQTKRKTNIFAHKKCIKKRN